MEPWQSWAIAVAGGGLAYYYYTSQNKQRPNRTRAGSLRPETPQSEETQSAPKVSKRENKSRRKPAGNASTNGASSNEAVSSAREESSTPAESKKKRKAGQKPPTTTHTAAPSAAGDTEGDSTDKAWAEQLASLKKGTSLAPPPQTDSRNRTIRQVAAGASPAVSSASSIGGTDAADDELSPALTPDLRAGDVSDMLEPARAGPSILRLTSPSNDSAAKKPRPQKEFQSAETKKQRQNRQKIEDRRLEREAAEKDRQAKLEAQRRTAREARGEPARNGIAVSKPPTTNAWAQQTAANATQTPVVAASNTQLLDTFEPDADSTSSSTGALNNSTAATSTTSNFENELPSEEDQMRMVSQMDGGGSGWSTVSVGKKKQKKTDPVADDQRNDEVPKASIKRERPAPAQRVKQNGFAYLDDQVSQFNAGSHPDDSQWGA